MAGQASLMMLTPAPVNTVLAAMSWISGRPTLSPLLSLLTLAASMVRPVAKEMIALSTLATAVFAIPMVATLTLSVKARRTSTDLARPSTPLRRSLSSLSS